MNRDYIETLIQAKPTRLVIRKIEQRQKNDVDIRTYVITIIKDKRKSLSEQGKALFDYMISSLSDNDYIDFSDKMFSYKGDGFVYTIIVEAYKNADKLIYYDNGVVISNLYGRMAVENALKYCRKYKIGLEYIFEKMNDPYLIEKLSFPPQRLDYLIKKERFFQKQNSFNNVFKERL